ncbi:glucokinase [Salinisphaera aquimarina]|uniref:Glucokinase n=1 Tax=Salinisphaera aquimarina TaxID=2094031 RepID=A0ABV7EQ85_9GAMM
MIDDENGPALSHGVQTASVTAAPTAFDHRLVADIGGTNARFGLLDPQGNLRDVTTLACADFAGPAAAIRYYLETTDVDRIKEAAIAVATPVIGDRVSLTNRTDWSFSIRRLQRQLRLDRLKVINDFTALALSLPRLPPQSLRQVGSGTPDHEAAHAVLGPGTGFGMSGLIPAPTGWVPLASEGGHVTFSAANDEETAILSLLLRRFGHVSAERLLSGPGLVNLHWAQARLSGEHITELTPEQITAHALADTDPLCRHALEIFCAMLGTAAANLVLTLGARGGVYIGGGIVPRLGTFFEHSDFRTRFEARGRLSTYLSSIPSYVVHADNPGLDGAAATLQAP